MSCGIISPALALELSGERREHFLANFFFMLELDGPTMTFNIGVEKLQMNQALTTVLCEGGERVLGVELEC